MSNRSFNRNNPPTSPPLFYPGKEGSDTAECTEKDLRAARKRAKMTQWQASQAIGVSESTMARWESGEVIPDPEDVDALEVMYKAPGLWHRWMRSHYDSYRKRYPEDPANRDLPLAIVNVRHQLEDVRALQDAMERDAMDGRMDDPQMAARYQKELRELQAAAGEALEKMKGG